jgi:hypothetical protein
MHMMVVHSGPNLQSALTGAWATTLRFFLAFFLFNPDGTFQAIIIKRRQHQYAPKKAIGAKVQ